MEDQERERPQRENEDEESLGEAQSELIDRDNPQENTDNDPPIIVQGG